MLDPRREEELLRRRFGAAAEPVQRPSADPAPPPEPPPPRVSPWWLTAPLALGLLLGVALHHNRESLTLGRTRLPTRTVAAAVGTVERSIRLTGTIAAKNSTPIQAPRVRGRGVGALTLIRLAEAGATVRKGDVIAELDREQQQVQIDNQEARIVQQDAVLRRVQANQSIEAVNYDLRLRRARGALNKARLDLRTAEVKSAVQAELLKNSVQQAEAELRQLEEEVRLSAGEREARLAEEEIDRRQMIIDLRRAEANVDRMLIRAPTDGMIVMMTSSRGPGDFSQVSNGDQLRPGSFFMQVVDASKMVLEAGINQVDSQHLRVGQEARLKLDAYPDLEFPGRLVSVGALATASTGGGGGGRGRLSRGGSGQLVRELAAELSIESNDRRIIPDLSASADVVIERAEGVVAVPRSALERTAGGYGVWVRRNDGRFRRRIVQTGVISDTAVEIRSGVEAGDLVAAEPPAEGEKISLDSIADSRQ